MLLEYAKQIIALGLLLLTLLGLCVVMGCGKPTPKTDQEIFYSYCYQLHPVDYTRISGKYAKLLRDAKRLGVDTDSIHAKRIQELINHFSDMLIEKRELGKLLRLYHLSGMLTDVQYVELGLYLVDFTGDKQEFVDRLHKVSNRGQDSKVSITSLDTTIDSEWDEITDRLSKD